MIVSEQLFNKRKMKEAEIVRNEYNEDAKIMFT